MHDEPPYNHVHMFVLCLSTAVLALLFIGAVNALLGVFQ